MNAPTLKAAGVKAVVFDWAGTVIDFGSIAPIEALRTAFARHGVPISQAEARADMGMAKRDHVRAILALPRVLAAWTDVHGHGPDEADGERVYADLAPLMQDAAARHTTLIPGAAESVAALRQAGIRIGSCTGYTREMMADILPRASAQGYAPDVVVCAGETAEGRPSPLMMWKVMVELGVWPASACIKVDDAEVGIAEGRAAGAWTVGVAASGNRVGLSAEAFEALDAADRHDRLAEAKASLAAAGADFVIDTVADLPPIVEAIAARLARGERPAA
jgi:phosphonoacetaldehyde hydrolase